jgi:hypothetical protein
MAVLGCFFEKKGLSWRPVHVGARHVRARYIFAPVSPSRPRLPSRCRPQGLRPTLSTHHCVRACLPNDVAVQVAANVDKVSQIYHGGQSTPV